MDFGPSGLGTSKWIPGVASTLGKARNPTGVLWATSEVPKPSLAEGPAPPELCPRQQVPAGCGFERGRRGWWSTICGSGKPAATSKPIMHDGLFLRLFPGFREPPWKFEKSLSMFWSMVFRSQLTSGTVFGEQVGCRLLMSHLNSLCFISCCWVLRWEQSFFFFFFYTVFLYAFCKVVLFLYKKKTPGQFCCKSRIYFERQVYLKFCI